MEHIHLSIGIKFPLIIQGSTGKGKKSAIYFIAKTLGYEVIYFDLSSSTTMEDLFCKKIPHNKNGKLEFLDIRSKLLDGIDIKIYKKKKKNYNTR